MSYQVNGIEIGKGLPDAFVLLRVRSQASNGVAHPLRGEEHTLWQSAVVVAIRMHGHRQDFFNWRSCIATLGKGEAATDHGKGASLADVISDVFKIVPRKVRLKTKIFEHDQIKVVELLCKQAPGGKWDEAELTLRYIDHV